MTSFLPGACHFRRVRSAFAGNFGLLDPVAQDHRVERALARSVRCHETGYPLRTSFACGDKLTERRVRKDHRRSG